MTSTCSTCRHWLHDDELHEWGLGECHRYAPHPISVRTADLEIEMTTYWPTTAHNDLCGDHATA